MKPDYSWFSSRRSFLLSGAAALTAAGSYAGTPSCVLASEQEEGPYYVDGAKLRGDLTEGKPGVPVKLRIALVDAKRCSPITNAALDIWQCDAEGVYSGFTSANPDGPGRGPGPDGRRGGPGMPPPGLGPGGRARQIDPTRFLRGVQITNQQGLAEFSTLYPGWYQGRAIHIHVKVHLGGEQRAETYGGGHVAHTGQFFFPEDLTERIAKLEPYAGRLQVHRTTQEEDHVFQSQHDGRSMVQIDRLKKGSAADPDGFVATVTLAVDPEATPQLVGGRGRGGPPPFGR